MHYRKFGRTDMNVAEVGYGAWGIGNSGWQGADDQESLRALHRYLELGGNFIDTAFDYGKGHSERLVGQAVREAGKYVYVATKVPPKNEQWPARAGVPVEEVFPGDHVRQMAETSYKNLGLEVIDFLQLHVWSDEWVGQGDWLEVIEGLKRDGLIRYFGVSINDHQPENALKLIETGVVDGVQVIYNVFDQSPEDRLLEVCQQHGVGVIARVPFDEGALTGAITPETTFPEGDFRNTYFGGDRRQQVDQRVRRILEDLQIPREALAETALRYILSHPAISTVIPGMRSIRNVERNVAVADGRGLEPEKVQKLHAHRWVRDFYTPAEEDA
ncbi:aryl-alcohol dehydrogenase-like predicted oxidoreductase [Deinobacterium chartae]|uniref:Aryl-alcohol dehydrogenase-like predicted oxidoreductase n=1 Tax=Deinobacterium chartae TaxID=521158 RepID=A0A841I557_9DEIO|nr:aldo/keto reductase [Deinobacterium chartae]MBB6099082.1 aryl-alcohol dehydrogenase-like predicted oxidoreductase [Deinobacterium chartae]